MHKDAATPDMSRQLLEPNQVLPQANMCECCGPSLLIMPEIQIFAHLACLCFSFSREKPSRLWKLGASLAFLTSIP
jgi:hypothetical protein